MCNLLNNLLHSMLYAYANRPYAQSNNPQTHSESTCSSTSTSSIPDCLLSCPQISATYRIHNLPQYSQLRINYNWSEWSSNSLCQQFIPINILKPRMLLYLINSSRTQSCIRISQQQLNKNIFTLLIKSIEWGDHL